MSKFQFVGDFALKHSKEWKHIFEAERLTNDFLEEIEHNYTASSLHIFSTDVDLVVFGSIARNECSKNSDIDWTVLVDGQSRPEHYSFGHIIKGQLEKSGLQPPGTTGMFGQLTFGHDLIHYIGGEDDTNHNITRRILLLLESDKINFEADASNTRTAYNRVIGGILNQYISNDSGFKSDRGAIAKVPRFLLNDVIRFWRTMCVDFAFKQRQQHGKKWALRNIKLRMSRKLIYVKGLLMCFSCYKNEALKVQDIESHLRELAAMKPLDVIIKVCTDSVLDENEIVELLSAYDSFLGILDDDILRTNLSNLNMLDVYKDANFINSRKITDDFQKALTNLFINNESRLKEFTLKYAIF